MSSEEKETPHPLYDNEKNWQQVNRLVKLIQIKAKNVEKNLISVIKETDEIMVLSQQMFRHVPKTDGTLFGFSPLAPNAIIEYFMDQIFKIEGSERLFARRIKARSYEVHKAPNFSDAMNLALGWATKMEKEEIKNIV